MNCFDKNMPFLSYLHSSMMMSKAPICTDIQQISRAFKVNNLVDSEGLKKLFLTLKTHDTKFRTFK